MRNVTVGSAALTFSDNNTATFAYILKGITQTKTITREIFGAQLPTCTFGLVVDLGTAYNYQGLWWAAPAGSEAGWERTQQGDVMF